jgi:hypothetical protein
MHALLDFGRSQVDEYLDAKVSFLKNHKAERNTRSVGADKSIPTTHEEEFSIIKNTPISGEAPKSVHQLDAWHDIRKRRDATIGLSARHRE